MIFRWESQPLKKHLMKTTLAIISTMVCGTLHAQVTDSSFFYYQKKAMEAKLDRRYQVASLLERSLSFNENNVAALIENALVNLEMRKTDQAKALFAKVLNIEPGNRIIVRNGQCNNFSYRQFARAIELANQCPDCTGAPQDRGYQLLQPGRICKSGERTADGHGTDPKDAEACYNLARTYLDMEEYKKHYLLRTGGHSNGKNGWIYLLHFTLNDYRSAMLSFQEAAEKGIYNQTILKRTWAMPASIAANLIKARPCCCRSGKKARVIKTSFGIWLKYSISKNNLTVP